MAAPTPRRRLTSHTEETWRRITGGSVRAARSESFMCSEDCGDPIMNKCRFESWPRTYQETPAARALNLPADTTTSTSGSNAGADQTSCWVSFLAMRLLPRGRWTVVPSRRQVVSNSRVRTYRVHPEAASSISPGAPSMTPRVSGYFGEQSCASMHPSCCDRERRGNGSACRSSRLDRSQWKSALRCRATSDDRVVRPACRVNYAFSSTRVLIAG